MPSFLGEWAVWNNINSMNVRSLELAFISSLNKHGQIDWSWLTSNQVKRLLELRWVDWTPLTKLN